MPNTPTVTDWLMVIITAIYVAATIGILLANYKSVKVSQKQIKTGHDQHQETIRLSYMPFLQLWDSNGENPMSVTNLQACKANTADDSIKYVAKLKNIGNGTAVNLVYDWKCAEIGVSDIDCVPVNAIASGDFYLWQITFHIKRGYADNLHPILTLSYEDILGNNYEQRVSFTFDENNCDTRYVHPEISNPEFKGIVLYTIANKR